jgi:LuxR family maltose regulon positive regulatory protein
MKEPDDHDATAGMPHETTIVRTKLRAPVEAGGLIARPRLLELLNQNSRRPLTVVSAPAGYGKTTLVMQWLQAAEAQPAWLQLSEDDSELRTF